MTKSHRILGIDYGSVRVGLAISDPTGFLARGLKTIQRHGSDDRVIDQLRKIITDYDIEKIVIGLPLRTDDRPGKKEKEVKIFAAKLAKAIEQEIVFQDERYSSVRAHAILAKVNIKERDRRSIIDQVAAEVILQDYLDEAEMIISPTNLV